VDSACTLSWWTQLADSANGFKLDTILTDFVFGLSWWTGIVNPEVESVCLTVFLTGFISILDTYVNINLEEISIHYDMQPFNLKSAEAMRWIRS
jgi:hypothetical protein